MNKLQRFIFTISRKPIKATRYKLAARHTSGRVLDIGCGQGLFAHVLGNNSDYLGIDKIDNFKGESRFMRIDVETEERNKIQEQFDTIVMLAFIEHLAQPEAILQWCCKLLKDNGKLVITTPTFIGDITAKLLYGGDKTHQQLYNKNSLRTLLSTTGFAITKYTHFELGMNQLAIANKEKIC